MTPFRGSLVALPSPFLDGALDLEAFREMVEHQARVSDGLVIAGTTGESATLRGEERDALLQCALEGAAGRVPVLAGIGTNCTRTTVELARRASELGADGLLVVTPYYNSPSPRGLLLHFGEVAQATDTPVVLYNVPSRTACDLTPDVVRELAARHPNIVAIKEAKPCRERARELVRDSGLDVLCGTDTVIADFMQEGAVGVIGVIANIVPEEVAELVRVAAPGSPSYDEARAAELIEFLAPLARDLFIEVNPVPVKAALARLARCGEEVRAPLSPLEQESRARLEATLRHSGVLDAQPAVRRTEVPHPG